MLREISSVRQDEPNFARRWFQDDYFDLFLWVAPNGRVSAFQLGYDRARHERVLSWSSARGFSHNRVDTGETWPMQNMTPLLVPGGSCPIRTVFREFHRRSERLEGSVRNFLLRKLRHGRGPRRLRRGPASIPEGHDAD